MRTREAAYPPTTWRTVTRLQSIKCVRLLWLMHYEAIKNGNYSSALCSRLHARARTLSGTGPHSMSDEYERAARCIARSTTLVDTPTTRAHRETHPHPPHPQRLVATEGVRVLARYFRSRRSQSSSSLRASLCSRESIASGKSNRRPFHSDIFDLKHVPPPAGRLSLDS